MKNHEYYIVQRVSETCWKVHKFIEDSSARDCNIVTCENNAWSSDDLGFKVHKNERANRRIQIVKEHLKRNEPKHSTYWFSNGMIENITVKV